jgi:4-hydroxy-tetrahydrodipicolinate synthase
MFIETNPTPAKTALGLMGKIRNSAPRLPLYKMSDANVEKLKAVMAASGLLKK